jgi:hypothetical protein
MKLAASPDPSPGQPLPVGRAEVVAVLAALALAVALALRLASVALNARLTSDELYSYLQASAIVAGKYPLSGWSFGGAPFFFPDFFIQVPALALAGPGGASFAVFAAVFVLALAGLVAAVARWWLRCRPLVAWWAGALAVNAALALQFLPQHLAVLWLLPLPGYHGGTLLNGLALVAFAGRLLGPPRPHRWVWVATSAVLFLGLCSDSLLLVQFVAPLLLAVWSLEKCGAAAPGIARRLALLAAGSVAAAVVVRLGLAEAGWGYYYRLGFRHTPTPPVLWHALGTFASETVRDLGPRAWGWGIGIAAWIGLALADTRSKKSAPDPRGLALHLLVVSSAAAMIAVLLFLGYWKSWVNVRYLLNALFLPLAAVAIAAARSPAAERLRRRGWAAAWLALGLFGATTAVAFAIDPAGWHFQPTTGSRGYAKLVAGHHLHRGLAGYWQANLLNILGGAQEGGRDASVEPRLNALLPDGQPYFWCNNAFWYFDPPEPDGTLRWPDYDFILTNDLDRPALLERFGPPAEIVKEANWEALIYDTAGQARIKAALAHEVIQQLGPRLKGLHAAP